MSDVEASWKRLLAWTGPSRLPERDPLPRWVAPIPKPIEDLGLRLAWLVVLANLAGTAFGFWWYADQLAETTMAMWPFVPDSPAATLFFAAAVAAWLLGHEQPWLTALAFFGNLVLGLWTPFVLVAFLEVYAAMNPALYAFMFFSHLAMVVQAFVLHRISDFPVWAIAVALAWFTADLLVDYFVPIGGGLHHTNIPVDRDEPMFLGADALGVIAAGEVTFTLIALFFALSTRVALLAGQADGVVDTVPD